MAEAKVVVVIGIPNPEVPIFGGLVDVAVGLRVKEFGLIQIHGVTLGFAAVGGSQVLFAEEFFGQFFSAIPSIFVLPLHEHSAGFVADQLAGFGSGGKVEIRGELEDFVGICFFRPDQLVKFREILPVSLRLVE